MKVTALLDITVQTSYIFCWSRYVSLFEADVSGNQMEVKYMSRASYLIVKIKITLLVSKYFWKYFNYIQDFKI
jgi:hypothetical protein